MGTKAQSIVKLSEEPLFKSATQVPYSEFSQGLSGRPVSL